MHAPLVTFQMQELLVAVNAQVGLSQMRNLLSVTNVLRDIFHSMDRLVAQYALLGTFPMLELPFAQFAQLVLFQMKVRRIVIIAPRARIHRLVLQAVVLALVGPTLIVALLIVLYVLLDILQTPDLLTV